MCDLLLVGAGHAHLHLVKHASDLRDAGYRVRLLAPRHFDYSGVASARATVRRTLQHADRDEVYAAGDCAHFLPGPLPLLGVHGVRQGPLLLRSLLARARGEALPEYHPQRRALSILDLGDGIGLAVRGRWWCYGAAALRLKRHIDRRWLRGYTSP